MTQSTNIGDELSMADPNDMYKCVHCGLCLSACPTYAITGLEMESPRGRIHFMKSVSEGRLELDAKVTSHWDLCLQCRACEAVCPSGVPYGKLITSTKYNMDLHNKTSPKMRRIRSVLLRGLLPRLGLLRSLSHILFYYNRFRLSHLLNWLGVFRLLPTELKQMEAQLPNFTKPFFKPGVNTFIPIDGDIKMKVCLLAGCIMPLVQSDAMRSAVRVLTKNGCEVSVPVGQGCCGALNLHAGDMEYAKSMARNNIDVMLAANPDYIITISAGCGASMKEYYELFQGDPEYQGKAQEYSDKTIDIHEFLTSIDFIRPTKQVPIKVTYQDACHLAHAQRITSAPRILLQSIPGLEFVEMPEANMCCGSAGIYSMVNPEMSQEILSRKFANISKVDCDVIATSNPGCSMHIQAGIKQRALPYDLKHVIEILDMAYEEEL